MSAPNARFLLAASVAGLALLAACGEREQNQARSDAHSQAWQGAQDPYMAPGWKPGDKASWEEQMMTRAIPQNEYKRVR